MLAPDVILAIILMERLGVTEVVIDMEDVDRIAHLPVHLNISRDFQCDQTRITIVPDDGE